MPMQMAEKYMTTIKEPFQYVLFYDHCLFLFFCTGAFHIRSPEKKDGVPAEKRD